MTKEITKSIILQEIQDKLKLREFAPAQFLFDETVVPIYNIEQHIEEWWNRYIEKSVTSTGAVYFSDVPPTQKWTLSRYDVVFMTGNFTLAGIYIKRLHRDPADAYCYLDLKAAQSTSYHLDLETPVVLAPGDKIYANCDGYTTTGNLRLYIDYMKEEIR